MLRKSLAAIICILVLCATGRAFGQAGITPENLDRLHVIEDSMLVTIDSMYDSYIPDTHTQYSEQLAHQLVRALKVPNSYSFPFDKLKDKINIIGPDDNAFRIFNWSVAPTYVTRRYYGAIQLPGEQLKLWGLVDYTEELGKLAEDSMLTNHKWYGALYYRILINEIDGRKVYTLLGLNAASPVSNKKVMDPMEITDNGISFGAQIFTVGSMTRQGNGIYRYIMEYKKEVQASLNWDDERKLVIFDKLVSQVNDPNRKYTFVPSGEYDGFRWENGQWSLVHNLIPITVLKDGQAPSAADDSK